MHVSALALIVMAVTAPSPSPSPQPALKVIGNVRSTPFCSALRDRIGPAIAGILSNDELIGLSRPAFAQLYHDEVLSRSPARAHFDMYRLEKLITPIVKNIKQVDAMLDKKPDDPRLQAMRDQLQAVVAKQKESLNVISGVVATEQLGELQGENLGDWENVFVTGPPAQAQQWPAANTAPAASNILSAGVSNRNGDSRNRDPAYNPASVGPTYDPFAQFVRQIDQQHLSGLVSENAAAKMVTAAVQDCSP